MGRELAPGDPLDAATRLGAIVDAQQMQRVLGYIDAGRADGARLAFGGAQARRDSGGYYVEPTVFDGVTPGMRIAREEIFGPVLATTDVPRRSRGAGHRQRQQLRPGCRSVDARPGHGAPHGAGIAFRHGVRQLL